MSALLRTQVQPHQPPAPQHRAVQPETEAQGNLLLAAMPVEVLSRWLPHLEPVDMPLGQVVSEAGRHDDHVHFPTSSIVSLLHMTASGACAEVATVGNDGLIGLPLLMSAVATSGHAVVQSAGLGYRLPVRDVLAAFDQGGAAMRLLLRYSQALITQVAQTVVCNRHHSVEQQVCRQLLLSLDRVQGSRLLMTQELLADKLGVRRESVTLVELALQRAGLIRYARGRIEVLDRAGLEDRACECYGTVKRECERLLPPCRSAASHGSALRQAVAREHARVLPLKAIRFES